MSYPEHIQTQAEWAEFYRIDKGRCAHAACVRRHASPDDWPPRGMPPITLGWRSTAPIRGYVEAKPKHPRPARARAI